MTYHHACAEQEAMDCLSHIGCVDLVVVRVLIFPIACLQGLQKTHQKHSGNLQEREEWRYQGSTRVKRQAIPAFFPWQSGEMNDAHL